MNESHSKTDRPDNVADDNIERLLSHAYVPEPPDADFVERVRARLRAAASELASHPAPLSASEGEQRPAWWKLATFSAIAATVVWAMFAFVARPGRNVTAFDETPGFNGELPSRTKAGNSFTVAVNQVAHRLKPRAVAAAPKPARLDVGKPLVTARGERQRAVLPDGSVVYADQGTRLALIASRQLRLASGEVYVEVAQQKQADGEIVPFTVETADRTVTALGTKFAVRADEAGGGVLVTQGKVRVSGHERVLAPGEQLGSIVGKRVSADRLAGALITPAPRATYALAWAQDLMAAAVPALVPASEHAGGALVAIDPAGQELKFSLRQYHVDVHVEDGFARTTIDQTYFNHEHQRLEGTFYFPLPPDASISRLAMYVGGVLMEGGMAERDYARNVFESIKTKMQDPALLEWVDGSTFKMRVFPLEPREEKRIVLSYTQRLSPLYGKTTYRFPAGHNLGEVREWSTKVLVKNGAALDWSCPSHELAEKRADGDVVLTASATKVKPDRDIVVELADAGERRLELDAPRFSATRHAEYQYLMLRYQPSLRGGATAGLSSSVGRRQGRNWTVLFETSADRDPLLARAQVEVARGLLTNVEHDDTFTVLTAGTNVRDWKFVPQPATVENVKSAIDWLEDTHLIGALDLEKALAASRQASAAANRDNYIVHLGSGVPVLGKKRDDELVKLLTSDPGWHALSPRRAWSGAKYVGIGVGKKWNRALMKQAASKTGGYFTQINPDENIAWRSFDVLSTLNAPRLLDIRVTDDRGGELLCYADSLAHGEELSAIARYDAKAGFPASFTITGTLDGRPYRQPIKMGDPTPHATYLPRMWAKLEIDRLLAADPAKQKDAIVSLSKDMYVMSPFTSLLVLENEAMYAEYKVDRGRKDHWAMYACPAKIPVVREPMALAIARVQPKPPEPATESSEGSVTDILRTLAWRAHPVRHPTVVWDAYGRRLWGVENGAGDINLDMMYGVTNVQGGGAQGLTVLALDDVRFSPPVLEQQIHTYFAQTDFYRRPGITNLNSITPEQALFPLSGERLQQYELAFRQSDGLGGRRGDVVRYLDDGLTRWGANATFAPDGRQLLAMPMMDALGRRGGMAAGGTYRFSVENYDVPGTNFQVPVRGWMDSGLIAGGAGGAQYYRGIEPSLSHFGLIADEPGWAYRGGAIRPFDVAGRRIHFGISGTTDFDGDGDNDRKKVRDLIRSHGAGTTVWNAPLAGTDAYLKLGDIEYSDALERFGRNLDTDFDNKGIPEDVWYELSLGRRMEFESVELREKVELFDGTEATLGSELWPKLRIQDEMLAERLVDRQRRLLREGERRVELQQLGKRRFRERFRRAPAVDFAAPWNTPQVALPNLRYQTPQVRADVHALRDLLSFAPGMQSTSADILAVLEAEAEIAKKPQQGRVDPSAKALIDRARAIGWRQITLPAGAAGEKLTIYHDGAEKFRYERRTIDGLLEQVVCDGRTLLHLYPEIGVGARRDISRHHRAEMSRLIPWYLAPAEDLARGAHVTRMGERTVAITPIEPVDDSAKKTEKKAKVATWAVQLEFAADGRLISRRLVNTADKKTLLSVIFHASGRCEWLDSKNKPIAQVQLTLRDSEPANLTPDVSRLVVLPLPWRSLQHVLTTRKLGDFTTCAQWSEDDALAVLAACVASRDTHTLWQVIGRRYFNPTPKVGKPTPPDHRLGFYTHLLSGGAVWWPSQQQEISPAAPGAQGATFSANPQQDHPNDPLAGQLTWLLSELHQQMRVPEPQPAARKEDGFTWHLAERRRLVEQLSAGAADEALRNRAIEYLKETRSPRLAWPIVTVLQANSSSDARTRRALSDVLKPWTEMPLWHYAAVYERARESYKAGDVLFAQNLLADLFKRTTDAGYLPLLDDDFKRIFDHDNDGRSCRPTLWKEAGERFISRGERDLAVFLAWQCHTLGDGSVSDELFTKALSGATGDEKTSLSLLASAASWQIGRYDRAESLIAPLLDDESLTQSARLWHLAADVADKLGRTAVGVARFERAVELAMAALPKKYAVDVVRAPYRELFGRYRKLATALATLQPEPPEELVARIVKAADRWRMLDSDATEACQAASRVLATLGAADTAWEYVSTPLAEKPNEASPWLSLAKSLTDATDLPLAERAYREAFAAEPTNAQILWDHAQLLEQHHRAADAQAIYRQIAQGDWQPRFQTLKQQASQRVAAATQTK